MLPQDRNPLSENLRTLCLYKNPSHATGGTSGKNNHENISRKSARTDYTLHLDTTVLSASNKRRLRPSSACLGENQHGRRWDKLLGKNRQQHSILDANTKTTMSLPTLTQEGKDKRRREWIHRDLKWSLIWAVLSVISYFVARRLGWDKPHGDFSGLFPLCVVPSIFGALFMMSIVSLVSSIGSDGDYNYDY